MPPVDGPAKNEISILGTASINLHSFRICSLLTFEYTDFFKTLSQEAARSPLAEWKKRNSGQKHSAGKGGTVCVPMCL